MRGNIAKRPNGRWRARYRDAAHREHSRHFDRKIDAQRGLDDVTALMMTGVYVDPKRGRVTIGSWTQTWLGGLVRKVHRVVSLVFALAVKDGRLARNPAAGVNLPRVVCKERRHLSHEQVRRLADECAKRPLDAGKNAAKAEHWNPDYRLVVLFLAYTGVRWGEMAAPRVGRIDFLRRRALIVESVTLVEGRHVWGTPKGHDRREVPVPKFLVEELSAHVRGKSPDDLTFTGTKGGPLRSQAFQRAVLTRAAKRIGVPGLHSPRAAAHIGIAGDRVGSGCEGGAADARTQVRNPDA